MAELLFAFAAGLSTAYLLWFPRRDTQESEGGLTMKTVGVFVLLKIAEAVALVCAFFTLVALGYGYVAMDVILITKRPEDFAMGDYFMHGLLVTMLGLVVLFGVGIFIHANWQWAKRLSERGW